MGLEEAIKILEVAAPVAEAIPVLGTPVKAALEATSKILEFAKQLKESREAAIKLAEQAVRWVQVLVNALNEAKTDTTALERMRPNVQQMFEALDAIAKWTEQQAKRGKAQALLHKSKDAEQLKQLSERLEQTHKRFMAACEIRNQLALGQLITDADRDVLASLKPVASAFYDSRSSPSGCLENTRTDVLEKMLSWANDLSPSMSIFWLAGLAGTGKSTIAKTFCERVAGPHTLLATFFASRNSADRQDPFNIIHTFSYELAVAYPVIRPHILSAIRSPPDIHERPMKEQIGRLFTEPFARQLDGRTIVLVIDALDECEKIGRVEGGGLIPLLADALRNHPVKLLVTSRQETSLVRMFDELTHIPLRLHEIDTTSVTSDVRRILENGFVDIRREHGLTASLWPSQQELDALVGLTGHFLIFATTALKYIGDERFTPAEQLCELLNRGATLEGEAPYAQIDALYRDILRAATRESSGHRVTRHSATRDDTSQANLRLCKRVGVLLRTVILLEKPLSVAALAQLMGAPMDEVTKDINALAAILLVSNEAGDSSNALVQIFHPSLRDFLLDPQRCRDNHLVVNIPQHNHELAKRCLHIMNEHLARNICRIDDFTTANAKIEDLDARILKFVPGALQYACMAWPVHLTVGDYPSSLLRVTLLQFTRKHLLHWLELASWCKQLFTAARLLPRVSAWCRAVTMRLEPIDDMAEWETTSNLLEDAYRMLRLYYIPIESHALHVYHSALATMPRCTLEDLAKEVSDCGPRLSSARDSGWGSVLQVMRGHTAFVTSVAFSPDGLRVASGSHDQSVRIWDPLTGHLLATCEGHTSTVWSVAFSPDGRRIVSGSGDSTVRTWDSMTGAQLAILSLEYVVLSVAFSPTSSQIASGSTDKLLRLCDAETGALLVVYRGHEDSVNSVAFSLDGTRLASASDDRTVRIWNASHGGSQPIVLKGHSMAVNSIAFSHGGMEVISASDDQTIRLWNTSTGHQLVVFNGHQDWVLSVAFTPDDVYVLSASKDGSVRIWDVRSGASIAIHDDQFSSVRCVASSSDGYHIIFGLMNSQIVLRDFSARMRRLAVEKFSYYRRDPAVSCLTFSWSGKFIAYCASLDAELDVVRVCEADTGLQLANTDHVHTSPVECIALCHDENHVHWHIASGLRDGTIRITHSGTRLVTILAKTTGLASAFGAITCVVFSLDGARVASGSTFDGTVTIWDTASKSQLAVLAGHIFSVQSVAFSPDGARIASTSSRLLKLWNAQTFQELTTIDVQDLDFWHDEPCCRASVSFTDEGDYLQACTAQKRLRVWNLRQGPGCITEQSITNSFSTESHREVAFFWNTASGWLSCMGAESATSLPICWLPLEQRGKAFAWRGSKVVICRTQGGIIVLDFADTVAALRRLAFV